MDRDKLLRLHLQKLLDWEDAHLDFDAAVAGVHRDHQGVAPQGLPYSLWQLLEHMRLTQRDILDFCRDRAYVEPPSDAYWPPSKAPHTPGVWEESVAAFRRDREALQELARDKDVDLFARIPHGTGQTYLRELLLVADHNAYHLGQLIAVRRCLGIWGDAGKGQEAGKVGNAE